MKMLLLSPLHMSLLGRLLAELDRKPGGKTCGGMSSAALNTSTHSGIQKCGNRDLNTNTTDTVFYKTLKKDHRSVYSFNKYLRNAFWVPAPLLGAVIQQETKEMKQLLSVFLTP